jgi:hypothetical protein
LLGTGAARAAGGGTISERHMEEALGYMRQNDCSWGEAVAATRPL